MIDAGSLASRSWGKFKRNMGALIGLYVVGTIVGVILGGLTLGIVGVPVFAGLFKAFRKAQQGETPDFNDIFGEFSNFGKWFMLWIVLLVVFLVLFVVTYVFLFIPVVGAIVALVLRLAVACGVFFLLLLMLDRDEPGFTALGTSVRYVIAHFSEVLLPMLLVLLLEGVLLYQLGFFISEVLPFGIGILLNVLFMPLAIVIALVVLFFTGPWMLIARWELYDAAFGAPAAPPQPSVTEP